MSEEKIQDNIYGLIGFDEHELRIIQSPLFQRLQWIKQMGPTFIVFPNAIHTRFSHSIGVFAITKRIIEQIKPQIDSNFDSVIKAFPDWQKDLKFAALLHDIGHVPFSHTGESVLQREWDSVSASEYATLDINDSAEGNTFGDIVLEDGVKLHESISAEIVSKNTFLDSVFAEAYGDKKEDAKKTISNLIIGRSIVPWMGQILHSELDADRLDYLLRDATFIGKAYGLIDLDYLISKMVLIKNQEMSYDLCIDESALQTVEHYILSRYFSKTQIIYNPNVAFLNSLMGDILSFMIKFDKKNELRFLKVDDIYRLIGDETDKCHEWFDFTDASVWNKIRKLHNTLDEKKRLNTEQRYINDCIKILMDGDIDNKLFWKQKIYLPKAQGDGLNETVRCFKNIVKSEIETFAKTKNVEYKRIKWQVFSCDITKYTDKKPDKDEQRQQTEIEAIRIAEEKDGNWSSRLISECDGSIIKELLNKELLTLCVHFVRFKSDKSGKNNKILRQLSELTEKLNQMVLDFLT